jgi:urease accessory protein
MTWHAQLDIDYARESERTVARYVHSGPLRILQSLYPEGDAICHNVIVHPPGGLVGGDTLDLSAQVAPGAHGLLTTPGATRFYRSDSATALQRTRLTLQEGARLEWLPLEALCYNGCQAENRLTLELASGAEFLGWDVTALGLPLAGQPFESGRFVQHLEIPGHWLERGCIDAADQRLLNSPLGLAGHRCMASLFFATGTALERTRRDTALDIARELIATHPLAATCGATSPQPGLVIVRALAPVVEPAMQLLQQIWAAWRLHFWRLSAPRPRTWSL